MTNKKIPQLTLWSCILGHGLEMYDFTLYGALITFITSHFFKHVSDNEAFFPALIALSVGYIARPLGAVIFGYIGDIYGRRASLIITISCASIATGSIGLCPSYADIGIVATIILFLARLTQGLCAGAETSSSSVYLIEHCTADRSSYGSAMIFLSGGVGCLIALIVSKIFLEIESIVAWRVPFILGMLFGIVVLYLRLKLQDLEKIKKGVGKEQGIAFFQKLFTHHNIGLVKTLGCGALSGITSTTIVVFVNLFLHKVLQVNMNAAILFSIYGLVAFLCSCFMCSKIASETIRNNTIMLASLGLILWAVPYFYLVASTLPSRIFIAQIVLGLLAGAFIAPVKSFLASQFSIDVRCTGVSVGYNTGYALTSGLYPIMAFKLIAVTGNIYSPALFIIFFAFLPLIAIYPSTQHKQNIETKN